MNPFWFSISLSDMETHSVMSDAVHSSDSSIGENHISVFFSISVPYKQYTDDTAMTRCIASSFISKQAFDAKDIARR